MFSYTTKFSTRFDFQVQIRYNFVQSHVAGMLVKTKWAIQSYRRRLEKKKIVYTSLTRGRRYVRAVPEQDPIGKIFFGKAENEVERRSNKKNRGVANREI